jgi:hypothetical protein
MDNLTRAAITDLWPLYVSGDVSQETRQFIESNLSQEPDLTRELSQNTIDFMPLVSMPPLQPDHELKTLTRLKRRLTGPVWILRLALICSGLAFGRIVADTSFDVSPRNFIITASIAACFWVAFLAKLWRSRRAFTIRPR